MKVKMSVIMLILGIIFIPFVFVHWLFIIAAFFAFISSALLK